MVYDAGKITLYVVKDDRVIPLIPALGVVNYEEAKQYLTKNACRISKEWPEDRALYLKDPFGITIDIVEKKLSWICWNLRRGCALALHDARQNPTIIDLLNPFNSAF